MIRFLLLLSCLLSVARAETYGNAEEIGEQDEAQGARSAATETYQTDRRGSENEVSAEANIGEADVKAAIAAGRSQHRATQRFARAAIYSAFPYAGRDDVQSFIAEMRERHGFDAEHLAALFARTRPLPAVLKAIAPPADPRVKSWQAYRARFIEPRRLAAGLAFWRRHAATLRKAAALTGVPEEIVVAILGIETYYGKHLGRFESFAALTTLAFDYPPRAELFRRELESLLLLARDEGRPPESYRGSYAGAIGLPQFLPSSIRAWAVDFDRSGRIDLTESAEDAIGSVANFLKAHGWEVGGPVALPVKVGPGDTAAALVAEGIVPTRRPAEMAGFGVSVPAETPDAPAALIDLVTPDAAVEYWLGYRNFYVLTRYNRSSFYAMAVYQLAQALREKRNSP